MAKAGDAYNAVVLLQMILQTMSKESEDNKRSNTNVSRAGGVGIGLLIGSLIFPGVGTAIGGLVGGFVGSSIGDSTTDEMNKPFLAETHYRLGVVYEMLRNPQALNSYTQAKLLNPSHNQATEALKRLQPMIPVTPQLAALDDEL
ncbi:MAG: tetratricopeptide repeat protein [Armatimonadota bacterium]